MTAEPSAPRWRVQHDAHVREWIMTINLANHRAWARRQAEARARRRKRSGRRKRSAKGAEPRRDV